MNALIIINVWNQYSKIYNNMLNKNNKNRGKSVATKQSFQSAQLKMQGMSNMFANLTVDNKGQEEEKKGSPIQKQ